MSNLVSAQTCDCEKDYENNHHDHFFNISNTVLLNLNHHFHDTTYHGLGETNEFVTTYKADLFSNIMIGDNFGITSTIRTVHRNFGTDFEKDFVGVENKDIDRVNDLTYSDIHFRTLYATYKLPKSDSGYRHMIAGGTMPFQGGAWGYYKTGTVQEANGLSMIINMPFDALVYVADFSKMVDYEFMQIRTGFGEYMKFRDVYPQNEKINSLSNANESKITFFNFDFRNGPHNLKADVYLLDWVFSDFNVGQSTYYGVGYAFDKLDDDGYVVYGTAGYGVSKGDFVSVLQGILGKNRDLLVNYVTSQYSMDYDTAAELVDYNLSNPTPEFLSTIMGYTIPDLAMDKKYSGVAFQIGAMKEFWIEKYDIDFFIGAEYYKSSKHWSGATFRLYPRTGIDPLLKGWATDLYMGVKFDGGKIFTVSWINEHKKYSSSVFNLAAGVGHDETNRNLIDHRNTIMLDFTWMFMDI